MSVIKMTDLALNNQRVLIREDLNVPVKDGKITSDARLRAALPTLKLALEAGAKVMVMSHLGRPIEGEYNPEFSLQPVANYLAAALNVPVRLAKSYLGGIEVNVGELVLFENIRFNDGEQNNNDELSKKLAALCDIFVMDAFGTAHRAQASTHGVAKYAPTACAGPLLAGELAALSKALDNPARPLVAIVGGSKVSTKLTVLDSLAGIVDQLVVGRELLAERLVAVADRAVVGLPVVDRLVGGARTLVGRFGGLHVTERRDERLLGDRAVPVALEDVQEGVGPVDDDLPV